MRSSDQLLTSIGASATPPRASCLRYVRVVSEAGLFFATCGAGETCSAARRVCYPNCYLNTSHSGECAGDVQAASSSNSSASSTCGWTPTTLRPKTVGVGIIAIGHSKSPPVTSRQSTTCFASPAGARLRSCVPIEDEVESRYPQQRCRD